MVARFQKLIALLSLQSAFCHGEQDRVFSLNEESDSTRSLQTMFSSSDNNLCVTECLDKNRFWCSTGSLTTGNCCQSTNCSGGLSSPICSYDTNISVLQRFICPQSIKQCGKERTLIAPSAGNTLTLQPGTDYFQDFQDGSSCGYLLKFPSIAGPTDTMRFVMDSLVRTSAYAVVAQNFKNTSSSATSVKKNDIITVTYPDNVYLIFISDTVRTAGYFSTRYKFVDYNPTAAEIAAAEAKIAAIPISERVIIIEEEFVETENQFVGSTTFYITVGVAALIFVVVIVAAICLYKMNNKNQAMMGRIKVLSQSQVVDGVIVSKNEAIQMQRKPTSKPTFGDEKDDNDFIKAQVSAILKDNKMEKDQFQQMFKDYVDKQNGADPQKNSQADVTQQHQQNSINSILHSKKNSVAPMPALNNDALPFQNNEQTNTIDSANISLNKQSYLKDPNNNGVLATMDPSEQKQNNQSAQSTFLPSINMRQSRDRAMNNPQDFQINDEII